MTGGGGFVAAAPVSNVGLCPAHLVWAYNVSILSQNALGAGVAPEHPIGILIQRSFQVGKASLNVERQGARGRMTGGRKGKEGKTGEGIGEFHALPFWQRT